jgi:hypothetical protein
MLTIWGKKQQPLCDGLSRREFDPGRSAAAQSAGRGARAVSAPGRHHYLVSASTRPNRAVGHPMLFDRAEGCRVWAPHKSKFRTYPKIEDPKLSRGAPVPIIAVMFGYARVAQLGHARSLGPRLINAVISVRDASTQGDTIQLINRLRRKVTANDRLMSAEERLRGSFECTVDWALSRLLLDRFERLDELVEHFLIAIFIFLGFALLPDFEIGDCIGGVGPQGAEQLDNGEAHAPFLANVFQAIDQGRH